VDEYKLPVVIGYLNSPPVNYCESGYTFKTAKSLRSNLKPGHYADYAEFLAKVAGHFQSLELPFTHISPVNEPQWFWQGVPGKAKQEGSPWTNEQIAKLVRLTDEEFRKGRVVTKLLIPEAADYQALCQPMPGRTFSSASDQINAFWKPGGRDYVGNLQTLDKAVAGHAYFSDGSMDKILRTRRMVKSTVGSLPGLRFWQTEYSLLGDGWTGGLPRDSVDEMTAALLLARNIHADFTLADATAWQWWSSTEPQFGPVSRYCLIACDPQGAEKFRATKLLWALGHYGRFIRPGMVRVETDPDQDLSGLMHSGYINPKTGHWVVVLINFSKQSQTVELKLRNTRRKSRTGYLTNREADMKKFKHNGNEINLPAHSIITLLSD
jgi:O-glycosyl hydrolase